MNQRIVCAANRDKWNGTLLIGVRHWDKFMHDQHSRNTDFCDAGDQGFIDNRGNFLTRQEAWKVAEAAGQIIRRVGGDDANGGTLYSENLY